MTGSQGLLAHALHAGQSKSCDLIFLSHQAFDLTLPVQMEHQLEKIQPQAVINTAAYNLVEQCKQERELVGDQRNRTRNTRQTVRPPECAAGLLQHGLYFNDTILPVKPRAKNGI